MTIGHKQEHTAKEANGLFKSLLKAFREYTKWMDGIISYESEFFLPEAFSEVEEQLAEVGIAVQNLDTALDNFENALNEVVIES